MESVIFYFFALITLFAALGVFLHSHPVMGALHLLATIFGVSGLFYSLNAPVLSLVHMIVLGGASVFIFVYTSISLKFREELTIFSTGKISKGLKVLSGGMFSGLILSSILFKTSHFGYMVADENSPQFEISNISKVLYTDFIFSLEFIVVLILVSMVVLLTMVKSQGGK